MQILSGASWYDVPAQSYLFQGIQEIQENSRKNNEIQRKFNGLHTKSDFVEQPRSALILLISLFHSLRLTVTTLSLSSAQISVVQLSPHVAFCRTLHGIYTPAGVS